MYQFNQLSDNDLNTYWHRAVDWYASKGTTAAHDLLRELNREYDRRERMWKAELERLYGTMEDNA